MSDKEVCPVVAPSHNPIGADGKPLRICCSCPETKTARDNCVLLNGEENCKVEIESHKKCLRALGFKV